MNLFFAIVAVGVALGMIEFWPHCAQPMLAYRRAGPMTTALLFATTLCSVVALGIVAVLALMDSAPRLGLIIAGAPWILVVGLPYLDDYRTLVRITGSR